MLIVRGPPGLGKSTTLAGLLKTPGLGGSHGPQYNYYLPTRARIREFQDSLAAYVVCPKVTTRLDGSVDPRSLCLRAHELKRARDSGRADLEFMRFCYRCQHREGRCPYWMQFREHCGENWLLTHDYLFLQTGDSPRRPSLHIIDEDIVQAAAKRVSRVSGRDIDLISKWIRRYVIPTWRAPLLRVLDGLRRVLDETGTVRNFQIAATIGDDALAAACLSWTASRETILYQELAFLRDAPEEALHPPVLGRLMSTLRQLAVSPTRACIRKHDDRTMGPVLVLHNLVRPSAGYAPVIIMDSTGSVPIYQKLFPSRTPEVFDVSVEVKATVYQITDGLFGRTQLGRDDGASMERLLNAIATIARHRGTADHPVGVIASQDFEQRLRARDLRHVVTGHYFAERGTNRFVNRQCRDIILVGTPWPAPDDIEMMAQALFGEDEEELDYGMGPVPRTYGMSDADGMDVEVDVWDYRDQRVREVIALFREGEMIQEAFRGRPLDDGGGKTIWVLSSLPLPGLPPTRLIRLDEIEERARPAPAVTAPPSLRQRVNESFTSLKANLKRRPTAEEVAGAAKCSKGTVSKYLARKNRPRTRR
jgi:hypothetical protein